MSSVGPGAVIAGKYRLIHLLGKGAMGEVWRAEHTTLGAPVAVSVAIVASPGGVSAVGSGSASLTAGASAQGTSRPLAAT